ncbi:MAG: SUMF1/EgtB/PvdO family nonheme iron enzyme [Pseudomonadota bacterium]
MTSPGTILANRYEILSMVEEGPVFRGFLALDREIEVQLALWLVREDLLPSPENRTAFIADVQRAKKISHPSLRRIFDAGEVDGGCYLTLQALVGESLEQRIAAGRAGSPEEIVDSVRAIASALATAAEGNLIHGWLRPADVLVVDGLPKVAGIGLWRSLDAAVQRTIFAPDRRYLAFEVRAGETPTARSDVYSLAMLIAELILGRAVGEDESVKDVIECIGNDRPDLATVLAGALAENPEDRPETANGLVEKAARALGVELAAVKAAADRGTGRRQALRVDQVLTPPSALATTRLTPPDRSKPSPDTTPIPDSPTALADSDRDQAGPRAGSESPESLGSLDDVEPLDDADLLEEPATRESVDPALVVTRPMARPRPCVGASGSLASRGGNGTGIQDSDRKDERSSEAEAERPADGDWCSIATPGPAESEQAMAMGGGAGSETRPSRVLRVCVVAAALLAVASVVYLVLVLYPSVRTRSSRQPPLSRAPNTAARRSQSGPVERIRVQVVADRLEPCPQGMRFVGGPSAFCVDTHEAPGQGFIPVSNVTLEEAMRQCRAHGKRLCTGSEWERACRGPRGASYPYGDAYLPNRCGTKPVRGTLSRAGSFPECVSAVGAEDMVGNAAEWVEEGIARGGSAGDGADARCSREEKKATLPVASPRIGYRCCTSPGAFERASR